MNPSFETTHAALSIEAVAWTFHASNSSQYATILHQASSRLPAPRPPLPYPQSRLFMELSLIPKFASSLKAKRPDHVLIVSPQHSPDISVVIIISVDSDREGLAGVEEWKRPLAAKLDLERFAATGS